MDFSGENFINFGPSKTKSTYLLNMEYMAETIMIGK